MDNICGDGKYLKNGGQKKGRQCIETNGASEFRCLDGHTCCQSWKPNKLKLKIT